MVWADEMYRLDGPQCWETHDWMGAHFTCERQLDHDGQHGSGAFVEYSFMWGEADVIRKLREAP